MMIDSVERRKPRWSAEEQLLFDQGNELIKRILTTRSEEEFDAAKNAFQDYVETELGENPGRKGVRDALERSFGLAVPDFFSMRTWNTESDEDSSLEGKTIEELEQMIEAQEKENQEKRIELHQLEMQRGSDWLGMGDDYARAREGMDRERAAQQAREEHAQRGLTPEEPPLGRALRRAGGRVRDWLSRRAGTADVPPAPSSAPLIQDWAYNGEPGYENEGERLKILDKVLRERDLITGPRWDRVRRYAFAKILYDTSMFARKRPRTTRIALAVGITGLSAAGTILTSGTLPGMAWAMSTVAGYAVGNISQRHLRERNSRHPVLYSTLLAIAAGGFAGAVGPWAWDQAMSASLTGPESAQVPHAPEVPQTPDSPSIPVEPHSAPPPTSTTPAPVLEVPQTPSIESPPPAPAPQPPIPSPDVTQLAWKAPDTVLVEGAVARSGIDGLVASKFAGADGFLQHMGYTVSDTALEQLKDALRRVVVDPAIAADLGGRVVERASGLDLRVTTGSVLNMGALGTEQALGELARVIQTHEPILFNELGQRAGLETFMNKWSAAFTR